jgi:hypothetical protein
MQHRESPSTQISACVAGNSGIPAVKLIEKRWAC